MIELVQCPRSPTSTFFLCYCSYSGIKSAYLTPHPYLLLGWTQQDTNHASSQRFQSWVNCDPDNVIITFDILFKDLHFMYLFIKMSSNSKLQTLYFESLLAQKDPKITTVESCVFSSLQSIFHLMRTKNCHNYNNFYFMIQVFYVLIN